MTLALLVPEIQSGGGGSEEPPPPPSHRLTKKAQSEIGLKVYCNVVAGYWDSEFVEVCEAVYSARVVTLVGTFRSEDEVDYEYEFSVLSMCKTFGGRHFSKSACSEQKTRTRSRPRPPI